MLNPLRGASVEGAPEPEAGASPRTSPGTNARRARRREKHLGRKARRLAAETSLKKIHNFKRWEEFLKAFRNIRGVVHIDLFGVFLSTRFEDNAHLLNAVSIMGPSS